MIPQYNTKLFLEFWNSSDDFLADWKASEFYDLTKDIVDGENRYITDKSVKLTFSLLLAKYGSNPIANMSTQHFEIKVWQIIMQYGPAWEKRLEIQKRLKNISEDELMQGSKIIQNLADNPSTIPGTGTLEELDYIKTQSTQNFKKSKLEGYAILTGLLESDVTSEYIAQFKGLFKQVVVPENPLLYVTHLEGDDE